MLCPFYGAQIDAFLMHFPKRRQFAQLADFGFDQFGGVFHFFFGGHAAEGDAQGRVGQLVVAAERAQYIAWLKAG